MGGLVTDPNYQPNLDPAIWGNTTTGNLGGGDHTDMNVTLQ